jgi:hypothetical protein
MSPTVIIDRREYEITRERIAEKLRMLGVEIYVRDLSVSNYMIPKETTVYHLYRENVQELLRKTDTGAIYNILSRLSAFDSLIIAEFTSLDGIELYMRVIELMLKALMRYSIYTLLVPDLITAKTIYHIATYEQSKKRLREKKLISTDPETLALGMLMTIPGVGPKTASRLLATFKSIRNLSNAPMEDIMKVEGIGEERARTIYEILNTDRNIYKLRK